MKKLEEERAGVVRLKKRIIERAKEEKAHRQVELHRLKTQQALEQRE